jgi:hypothetical protein
VAGLLLARIDATHADGDSDCQFRIHEITAFERLPGGHAAGDSESDSGKGVPAEAGKTVSGRRRGRSCSLPVNRTNQVHLRRAETRHIRAAAPLRGGRSRS